MPKDTSIEETNFMTQKAEAYLAKNPNVDMMITTVGQSSSGMGATQATAYKSEINVKLVDKSERDDNTNVFSAKIKRELEKVLIGAKVTTVPVGIMGAEEAPVQLVVTGNTLEDVLKYAKQVEAEMKSIDGTSEVKLSVEEGNPEISVSVDRDKMTALGLNVATVGQTLRTAFSGNTDNKFRTGNSEYDINIIFDEADRTNIDNIRNIEFINGQGQRINLSQFADVAFSSGPALLERYNRSPSVTVKSQIVGKSLQGVTTEVEEKLKPLKAPEGVKWKWGGNAENQAEGFGTLGYALVAAVLLVYMIMVILYNDFVKPFIVLFSIPLSFIGALWALALTNESINIFTILGIIMLIGLVAKNAILLVDFANHRIEQGDTIEKALIEANHARLRPILMTTIAMVFGMLPIAMASGAGAEMNNGLAIVIIGGLLSSLFLTLIIVPVVYYIIVRIEDRFFGHKKDNIEELMVADYDHKDVAPH